MRIIITNESVQEWAAYFTAKCILDYSENKNFVLSFPIRYAGDAFYNKLVSFVKDNVVSFNNVHIVSAGEYIGSNYSQGYIKKMFLDKAGISDSQVHLFNSNVLNRKEEAKRMEAVIQELGGITLLIDVIGEDGTFLLNSPASSLSGGIRDKRISDIIRSYESRNINVPIEIFPQEGFTLGFNQASEARYILLMAGGYDKADALANSVERPISQFYPTSALQMYKKLIVVADEEAVSNITVRLYKYSKNLESKSLHPKELIKGLYKAYYALTNCKIFDGEKFIEGHCVLVENNIIKSVEKEIDVDAVITRIDLGGKIIAPGFIDLQVNGCGGYDINMTPDITTLQKINETNHNYGCTSYLPTIITTNDEYMLKIIDLFNHIEDMSVVGALGIHFEGPYISKEKKGIHDEQYIRQPSKEMIERIASSKCTMITVAPEQVDGEVIKALADSGIIVSLGHTNGTYAEIKEKIPYGIKFATHLFNAMRPWGSREPGAVGAVLESKNIYAGIIVDGLHCDFASVELAYKLKQEHICIVTDAIPPAGTEVKEFKWAGKTIYREGHKYIDKNGTLAGASIVMSQSVRNMVNKIGATLEDTLKMASLYPARAMGIDDKYGKIKEGYIADMVILDDKLLVKGIVVKGKYKEQNTDYEWVN